MEADATAADRVAKRPSKIGPLYLRVLYLLVGLKLFLSVLLVENEGGIESAYAVLPKIVDAVILAHGVFGIAIAPSTRRKWRVVGASLALFTVVAFSQAFAGRSQLDGVVSLAKFLAPLLLLSGALLNIQRGHVTGGGARVLVWWVVGLILVGLFTVEPSFRNGREWLPAYFSGTHTSSYVAALCVAIVMLVSRRRWYRDPLVAASLLLGYLVVFGWGVRTAMVAGSVALTYVALARVSAKQRFLILVLGVMASTLGLIVATGAGLLSAGSLEWFSSGRTSVWMERIATISARPLGDLLVGSGAGTNVATSSVWWWEDKDSHNDFIAVAYEQGLLGLALTCTVLVAVYRIEPSLSLRWKAIWLVYLACSVLSNGLMFRPTPACVFAVAAILASRARPSTAA